MFSSSPSYLPQAAGINSRQMRSYKLRVWQQPVRARMCGFGDRDRRLLTPPVIMELLVYDSLTGRQINAHEVDTAFLVLNADLWDPTCTQELNIVLRSVFCNYESTASFPTATHHSTPIAGPSTQLLPEWTTTQPGSRNSTPYSYLPSESSAKSNSEMTYTRNLIGALAQSPSKLKGMDGNIGIFFIFHDLSIRTEGTFRLRFMLVVLGNNGKSATQPTDILATTFSEPFQVYSAKKFPGMLGPTDLTRHFASQRERIPTRTRKPEGEEAGSTNEDGDDELSKKPAEGF